LTVTFFYILNQEVFNPSARWSL